MTRNQLEYNKLLEGKRAARAQERLKGQEVSLTHQREVDKLQETRRANLAKEAISVGQLQETGRANRAQEALTKSSQRIAEREAATREYSAREGARANRARESEAERTNRANEVIRSRDVAVKESRAGFQSAKDVADIIKGVGGLATDVFDTVKHLFPEGVDVTTGLRSIPRQTLNNTTSKSEGGNANVQINIQGSGQDSGETGSTQRERSETFSAEGTYRTPFGGISGSVQFGSNKRG